MGADTDNGLALTMLELALPAETVDKICKGTSEYVDFDWLEKLVRHGKFDRAKGLLAQDVGDWQDFRWANKPVNTASRAYQEVHQDVVPTFVSQLSNKACVPWSMLGLLRLPCRLAKMMSRMLLTLDPGRSARRRFLVGIRERSNRWRIWTCWTLFFPFSDRTLMP